MENNPQQSTFKVEVDCYSGYRGEETPQRFRLGDRKVEVQEVLDRWLAPDHRYFKIIGDDQAVPPLLHPELAESRFNSAGLSVKFSLNPV